MVEIERILNEFQSNFFMGDSIKARKEANQKLHDYFEKTYTKVQKGRMPDKIGMCECGHDRHHRMVMVDCSRCGCQLFRPRYESRD